MATVTEDNSGSKQDDQLTYACVPCSRDNIQITCTAYCTDCQEHYCDTCIQFHNRFRLLMGHTVNTFTHIPDLTSFDKPAPGYSNDTKENDVERVEVGPRNTLTGKDLMCHGGVPTLNVSMLNGPESAPTMSTSNLSTTSTSSMPVHSVVTSSFSANTTFRGETETMPGEESTKSTITYLTPSSPSVQGSDTSFLQHKHEMDRNPDLLFGKAELAKQGPPTFNDPLMNVPDSSYEPTKSTTATYASPSLSTQLINTSSTHSSLLSGHLADDSSGGKHEQPKCPVARRLTFDTTAPYPDTTSEFKATVTDKPIFDKIDVCPDHAGEAIRVYCGNHDVVGCSVCVAISHRACANIKYIPDIAEAFVKSTDMGDFIETLERLGEGIAQLRVDRLDDLRRLSSKREDNITFIKKLHDHILQRIEVMLKNTLLCVDVQYDVFKERIEHHVRDCDSLRSQFGQIKETLNALGTNQFIEMFIIVKRSNLYIERGRESIEEVCEYVGKEHLRFDKNPSLMALLMKTETLGTVYISDKENILSTAQRFPITSLGNVESLCEVSPKRVAYIQHNTNTKKYLLVLHEDGKSISDDLVFDIPGQARGMCFNSKTHELAIAKNQDSKGTIVFFKIANGIFSGNKVVKRFSVQHTVFGISYFRSQLIIGSHQDVYVYTRDGAMLRYLFRGMQSDLLRHIAVNETDDKIYVANFRKGILELNLNGEAIQVITDKYLQGAHGVCIHGNGDIIACGYTSGCVVKFNSTGSRQGVIVMRQVNKGYPVSLCNRSEKDRLIVTFHSIAK